MIFSIVIPVYNSESTIKDCIQSILLQSINDFEILVFDNNSTDRTLSIISKIHDPRIRVYSGKDQGVYDAMNKGIKYAKGIWIYFLGSDDKLKDEFVLENLSMEIDSTDLPIIYGNVQINGDTGWARNGEIYAGEFSKNRMLRKSICHQAIFYRVDFLISNNMFFDLRYPVSADWHFNLRCRRLTKFKYVNQIIAIFAAGGISSSRIDSFPDVIKTEFSDMLPSNYEILFKEILKKIIKLFK